MYKDKKGDKGIGRRIKRGNHFGMGQKLKTACGMTLLQLCAQGGFHGHN